jgi:cell wall-associated NlpC family hydrolase
LAARRAQRGDEIAAVARTFTGSPYRRGGLSSRGIDCSGLAVRALGTQGINAPHNAAMLFRMGTRVSYAQLQPGDLVFFNTRGAGVSHVGIWLGDNKFVHAARPGRGVVVDRMRGYYSRRLLGARRLH